MNKLIHAGPDDLKEERAHEPMVTVTAGMKVMVKRDGIERRRADSTVMLAATAKNVVKLDVVTSVGKGASGMAAPKELKISWAERGFVIRHRIV